MSEISVNKVLLIGSLEKDPELRYTSNNTPICQLRVVTTEKYTSRDGQQIDAKSTHTVTVWGQKGERIKDQAQAGSRVYVEGSIKNRSYEDTSGNKKWVTEVNAQTVFSLPVGEGAPVESGHQGGYSQSQGGNYGQPQQSQAHNTPPQQPSHTNSPQSPPPTTQGPATQPSGPATPSTGTNQGPAEVQANSSNTLPEDDLPF